MTSDEKIIILYAAAVFMSANKVLGLKLFLARSIIPRERKRKFELLILFPFTTSKVVKHFVSGCTATNYRCLLKREKQSLFLFNKSIK